MKKRHFWCLSLLCAALVASSGCCRLTSQRLAEPIPVVDSNETQKQPGTVADQVTSQLSLCHIDLEL